MAIIWGLAAALAYGSADFFTRGVAQKEGSIRVLLYMQLVGVPIAALLLFTSKTNTGVELLSLSGFLCVLVGLVLTLGTFLLFRALALGPLFIVSPVSSSFAAVTVALSLIFGERPTALQNLGLVITAIGVVLAVAVSSPNNKKEITSEDMLHPWISSGVLNAVGAAVLFGVGYWLLRYIVPVVGQQMTVVIMRVTAAIFWVAFSLIKKKSWSLHTSSSLIWIVPISLLDTLANLFYNIGVTTGFTSIVSMITSSYSVVTIILAYLFIREKITKSQKVGVMLSLIGIALVST